MRDLKEIILKKSFVNERRRWALFDLTEFDFSTIAAKLRSCMVFLTVAPKQKQKTSTLMQISLIENFHIYFKIASLMSVL